MDEIIAAIDVGTSKTAVVIAENTLSGPVPRGFGIAHTDGVVRGMVVNIEKAQQGILKALNSAEKQAQLRIKQLVVAFGGGKLRSVISHGMVTIPRDRGKVVESDIVNLVESSKRIPLPKDAYIVDFAVTDFSVDGKMGIINPVGIAGTKLEGDVLLFITQLSALHNLHSVLEGANVQPIDHVATSIAAGEAILKREEKYLGAAIIDIGAGTTDVLVYKNEKPRFSIVVPYAGESVTHDLSVGLKITRSMGEKIKLKHGCSVENTIPIDETVEFPATRGHEQRVVKKKFIGTIIEARLEEIFMLAQQQLADVGGVLNNKELPAGVVLTGGTSLTPQIVYLTERILKMPVRLGLPGDKTPVPEGMNTPDYHSAWGAINVYVSKCLLMEHAEALSGRFETMWNKLKGIILKRL